MDKIAYFMVCVFYHSEITGGGGGGMVNCKFDKSLI